MVLLDQDAVPQRQALVLSAADTHRIFLRLAQTGQRLACVENRAAFRVRRQAGDGFDIAPRRRRHGGQHLQEVQCAALSREQRARLAVDAADLHAGDHRPAFGRQPLHRGGGVEGVHAMIEPAPAAQHRRLLGDHVRTDAPAGRREQRRPVGAADVFGQGIAHVARQGFVEGFVVLGHRVTCGIVAELRNPTP